MVSEAAGEAGDHPGPVVHRAKEQAAGVRRDVSPVEIGHDLMPGGGSETQRALGTLCHRNRRRFGGTREVKYPRLSHFRRFVNRGVVRDPG
jgi:hypothetical protein